jgi:hypothetical protein
MLSVVIRFFFFVGVLTTGPRAPALQFYSASHIYLLFHAFILMLNVVHRFSSFCDISVVLFQDRTLFFGLASRKTETHCWSGAKRIVATD